MSFGLRHWTISHAYSASLSRISLFIHPHVFCITPENHYRPSDIPQWSHGSCRCHSLLDLATRNPEVTTNGRSNYSLRSEIYGLCIWTHMRISGFSFSPLWPAEGRGETRETLRHYTFSAADTSCYFKKDSVRISKFDLIISFVIHGISDYL